MIRAIVHGAQGPVVLLGLTHENIARLLANEPISVKVAADPPDGMGLAGAPDIIVIAGSDEQTIADALRQYMTSETKIHDTSQEPR